MSGVFAHIDRKEILSAFPDTVALREGDSSNQSLSLKMVLLDAARIGNAFMAFVLQKSGDSSPPFERVHFSSISFTLVGHIKRGRSNRSTQFRLTPERTEIRLPFLRIDSKRLKSKASGERVLPSPKPYLVTRRIFDPPIQKGISLPDIKF